MGDVVEPATDDFIDEWRRRSSWMTMSGVVRLIARVDAEKARAEKAERLLEQQEQYHVDEMQKKFDCIASVEAERDRYRDALKDMEQFCTWLCEDSNKYRGTDAGSAAAHKRVDIRRTLGA